MLVVEKDPGRCSRFAVRWLRRLLEEDGSLTIEEASLAAAALAALGGRGHEEALSTLSPWPTERPGSRYDAGPPAYFKPEVVGEGNEAEPIAPSNRAAGGVVRSLRVFPSPTYRGCFFPMTSRRLDGREPSLAARSSCRRPGAGKGPRRAVHEDVV